MPIDRKRLYIAPSLIASDLSVMGKTVAEFSSEEIDLLHLDIMDGNFVPNITFGPGYIKSLKAHTNIPLDVHLMIEQPERSVEEFLKCEPWVVAIHYEATRFPARLMSLIREHGSLSGLALNPATPLESAFDLLEYSDMVLIMSVDPGFYGQSFMPASLRRIERLRKFIDDNSLTTAIQVDGGISADNIGQVVKAGANIIVAGNSIFKGGDPNTGASILRAASSI